MAMTSYRRMFTNFKHRFPVTSGRILFMNKLTSDMTELQSMNITEDNIREGANKQVISSQADSLIKISRIWADFFPANTSNQPI